MCSAGNTDGVNMTQKKLDVAGKPLNPTTSRGFQIPNYSFKGKVDLAENIIFNCLQLSLAALKHQDIKKFAKFCKKKINHNDK